MEENLVKQIAKDYGLTIKRIQGWGNGALFFSKDANTKFVMCVELTGLDSDLILTTWNNKTMDELDICFKRGTDLNGTSCTSYDGTITHRVKILSMQMLHCMTC